MKTEARKSGGFPLFLAVFGALPALYAAFGAHDILRYGWAWLSPAPRSVFICAAALLLALAGLSCLPLFRAAAGSPGARKLCFALFPLAALAFGVELLSGAYVRVRHPPHERLFREERIGHPLYAGFDWGAEVVAEAARVKYRYAPFRLWQAEPLAGPLMNIAEDGTRATTPAPAPAAGQPFVVDLYGGSTVFCLEVPDEYTLASCLGRALARRLPCRAVTVRNLGVPSYVREQEAIWFDMRLAEEDAPHAAIFYDGANDLAIGGWEGARHKDLPRFEAAMRGEEEPIWRLAAEGFGRYTNLGALFALRRTLPRRPAAAPSPEEIAARAGRAAEGYLRAGQRIRKHASAGGVAALFFLQPNLYLRQTPAGGETVFLEYERTYRPGIIEMAREFRAAVTRAEAARGADDFRDLSGVFDGETAEAYFDIFHVGPRQNEKLAEAMAERIVEALSPCDPANP